MQSALGVGQHALSIEQFKQQKVKDVMDSIYKSALTEESLARAEASRAPEPTIPIPGADGKPMPLAVFKSLPKDEHEYLLAKQASKKLGDDEFMTRREFKLMEPTDKEKWITAALENPRLMDAAKELAKAGSTSIYISPADRAFEQKAGIAKADVMLGNIISDVDKEISGLGTVDYEMNLASEIANLTKEALGDTKPTREQEAEIIAEVKSRDRLRRLDSRVKNKMRGSLKKGERIALMRDKETDIVGWYLIKPDGAAELLLEVPR